MTLELTPKGLAVLAAAHRHKEADMSEDKVPFPLDEEGREQLEDGAESAGAPEKRYDVCLRSTKHPCGSLRRGVAIQVHWWDSHREAPLQYQTAEGAAKAADTAAEAEQLREFVDLMVNFPSNQETMERLLAKITEAKTPEERIAAVEENEAEVDMKWVSVPPPPLGDGVVSAPAWTDYARALGDRTCALTPSLDPKTIETACMKQAVDRIVTFCGLNATTERDIVVAACNWWKAIARSEREHIASWYVEQQRFEAGEDEAQRSQSDDPNSRITLAYQALQGAWRAMLEAIEAHPIRQSGPCLTDLGPDILRFIQDFASAEHAATEVPLEDLVAQALEAVTPEAGDEEIAAAEEAVFGPEDDPDDED